MQHAMQPTPSECISLQMRHPTDPVHHIILVVTVTWAVLKSPTVKAMEGNSLPVSVADVDLQINANHQASEDFSCPVLVEIFCGSARVTACVRALGATHSFGIDHVKKSAVAPVKLVDLTTTFGQARVRQWISNPSVKGLFLAPPCGTCSLARSIILRDKLGRRINAPKPLRSESTPRVSLTYRLGTDSEFLQQTSCTALSRTLSKLQLIETFRW